MAFDLLFSSIQRIRLAAWACMAVTTIFCFVFPWFAFGAGPELGVVCFTFTGLAVSVPAGIACIYFHWRGRHGPMLRLLGPSLAGVFLGTCAFIFASSLHHQWHVRKAMERGDRLVLALDLFHSEHGTFPSKLIELEPTHIPTVPDVYPTIFASYRFHYDSSDNAFSLSFPCGLFDDYEWNRSLGWRFIPF